MESSTFDRLTRLFGNSTRRRTALAATAATGIAALTAGTAGAQRPDDELEAEEQGDDRSRRRRRRRRRRNRRTTPVPPVGANIAVVAEVCTNTSEEVSEVIPCSVNCPPGFVASGGGFNVGDILETLGTVRQRADHQWRQAGRLVCVAGVRQRRPTVRLHGLRALPPRLGATASLLRQFH